MKNYENLHLIHDAVVDWEDHFVLDLKPDVEPKVQHLINEDGTPKHDIVTVGNRSYYVINGHLWPL